MRRYSTLAPFAALILVVAGAARAVLPGSPLVDGDAFAAAFAGLPADAREVAERLAACSHFAGEFNGDRSDRDKEVTAKMTELHCDRIDADVEAIRHEYANDPSVNEALTAASQF